MLVLTPVTAGYNMVTLSFDRAMSNDKGAQYFVLFCGGVAQLVRAQDS